ncbi:hypothetical protein [Pigmentibacter ruber]|uniref:hypothetical protein n=1 Tax=Pigmentibacter ruber TaxID=2683196 RepID=UPI00131C4985|nr:hypothetical protein [Pigmentibacter ruber]
MVKYNIKETVKFFWERDYRSILQGLRTAIAILVVVFIYAYFKDISLFFMGICALGLSQSSARTLYWRFEVNMLLSFFISIMLVFISYPYSFYISTTYIFLFLITFLLYVCTYYQITSLFSIWAYFIPLNSIMTIKTHNDFIKYLLMDTVAFSICYLVSVLIIPPKLKKECYYELKSVLHEVNSYLQSLNIYMNDKSDKNSLVLTMKREKIFFRLKNVRILLNELTLIIKKGKKSTKNELFPFYILIKLIEKYVENILGISIKIRGLNINLELEDYFLKFKNLIDKINQDLIKFLSNLSLINLKDLGIIFEKWYLNILVEFRKFEKIGLRFSGNEEFNEILFLVFLLKDNISLINKEFKILSKAE